MSQQVIDGLLLKEMIIAGANLLEQNREAIDALNVFPVPDGDTGTNMSLTMKSTVKEIAALDLTSASKLANMAARGALKGARGNSGVILSQILRGFARGIEGCDTIDAEAKRLIKKTRFRKNYRLALHGWMEYQIAAMEISTTSFLSNPAGKKAKKTLELNFGSGKK